MPGVLMASMAQRARRGHERHNAFTSASLPALTHRSGSNVHGGIRDGIADFCSIAVMFGDLSGEMVFEERKDPLPGVFGLQLRELHSGKGFHGFENAG